MTIQNFTLKETIPILLFAVSLLAEWYVSTLGIAAGVPSTVTEIILDLYVSWALWKKLPKRLQYFAAAPAFIAIGDFSYGLGNYLLKLSFANHSLCLTYVVPYIVAMGIIIAGLNQGLKSAKKADHRLIWLGAISSIVIFAASAVTIIWPALFEKQPPLSPLLAALTVIFTILESTIIGLSAALLVVSATPVFQIALFGILSMHVSDIAIRYQSVHTKLIGMSIFENGWLFGIVLLATAALIFRERHSTFSQNEILQKWMPLASLRGMVIGTVFASLVALWVVLAVTGQTTFTAAQLSGGLLVICSAFCIAVLAANGITRQLTEVVFNVIQRNNTLTTKQMSALPFEIGSLVTEFERLRIEIEKEKNTTLKLTAQVIHDLGTPISVMKVMTPALRHEVSKDGCSCAQRLEDLIEGLTLAAQSIERISHHLLNRRKELLDIQPLRESTRGAVSLAQKSFPTHQIQFSCSDETPGPHVEGLSRIISNLIKNAVEASPPETPVLVSLDRRNGHYVLNIKDCGSGIPRSVLSKVEAGENITTKETGNGLGLSSMIEWTRRHGARYIIRTTENEGTEISLLIAEGGA